MKKKRIKQESKSKKPQTSLGTFMQKEISKDCNHSRKRNDCKECASNQATLVREK